MAIIINNSNSLPTSFNGVYGATATPPPSTLGGGASNGQPTQPVNSPIQIAGLVPVFPCCIPGVPCVDSKSSIYIQTTDCMTGGNYSFTFTILIGGIITTFPPVTFPYNSGTISAAAMQALINASLAGSGFTSNVVITSGIPPALSVVYHVTLLSPTGSCSEFNDVIPGIINTTCINFWIAHGFTGGTVGKGGANACDCDCRQGKYFADSIPDDQQYQLPVFASTTCTGSYYNDKNVWVFEYALGYNPIINSDFTLTKWNGTTWVTVAVLNNNVYGTVINTLGICVNVNYAGFIIDWNAVLVGLGEGLYQFNVNGSFNGSTSNYCFFSPPFCLKTFDCNLASGTVKFITKSCGGTIGSVTTQGQSWSICCVPPSNVSVSNSCISTPLLPGQTGPLPFNDSIRFPGYFGKESADYQETNIKLATGVIQKTRQEAIKTFLLDSDLLPFWFHQRFYVYGLMADNITVSDYNMNNPNYNYKNFSVVRDSSYPIKYSDNSLRFKKVLGMKFKEGIQLVMKDSCC